jgi:hypothetical protein
MRSCPLASEIVSLLCSSRDPYTCKASALYCLRARACTSHSFAVESDLVWLKPSKSGVSFWEKVYKPTSLMQIIT